MGSAGFDTRLYVAGYDLSSYFRGGSLNLTRAQGDQTTWGDSSMSYLQLLKDANISLDGIFEGNYTDEVQTLSITGTPTGGTFTITYDGQTTAALDFDATATEVKNALEALTNIGVGQITCTGGALPGASIVITFGGNLANTNVSLMTTTDSLTGGTTPASAIVATTQGGTALESIIDSRLNAALGSGAQLASWVLPSDALGNVVYGLVLNGTAYQIDSPVDGLISLSAAMQATGGADRMTVHHALGAETGAANGTAQDNGAATTNGGVGYMQVTAFTGTDCTIVVQDSADGTTDWQPILSFAQVTGAPDSERVAISGTVRRYTRYAITGTFTSATFHVAFGRL